MAEMRLPRGEVSRRRGSNSRLCYNQCYQQQRETWMAILKDNSLDFISSSEAQTVRLGVRLGELLQPGDVLCLSGPLGSGKTALARGVGRGWGSAVRVTSPTFTLINEYPRARDGQPLYHMDCYRLRGPAEAATYDDVETTGLFDLLDEQFALQIEWAERVQPHLPNDRLWITLSHVDSTRRALRFEASGTRAKALLQGFRKSAFGQ